MRLTDRHRDLEELSPGYLESARRPGDWPEIEETPSKRGAAD